MNIGLLIQLQGPAGIWGPSCETSARLAVHEINAAGGIGGHEIALEVLDAGLPPDQVAARVSKAVAERRIDAVVAMHPSDLRARIAASIAGRVPYIYTPQYEGGERHPGVYTIGETSRELLPPAMSWVAEHERVQRWFILGNDYVWPRRSAALVKALAARTGARLVGERYVPWLYSERSDFSEELAAIRASGADGVLVMLLGEDAIMFHRAFGEAGMAGRTARLCLAFDENLLYAVGEENTERLYSVSAYFANLDTRANNRFLDRYLTLFGARSPVPNMLGQSCYEGVHFLKSLVDAVPRGYGPFKRRDRFHLAHLSARSEDSLEMPSHVHIATVQGIDFKHVASF
ncbi:substrate-binding domain-containing protein (plasmid) [Tistrella mobilis]|uniref:substrate-binding domain-containing protein n=1 Tax=Tistrella mobilis TaxID=171437 RepID=UPI00355601D0